MVNTAEEQEGETAKWANGEMGEARGEKANGRTDTVFCRFPSLPISISPLFLSRAVPTSTRRVNITRSFYLQTYNLGQRNTSALLSLDRKQCHIVLEAVAPAPLTEATLNFLDRLS